MDCLLPAVFLALSGGEVADPRMRVPPPGVGVPRQAPGPPAAGKSTYGEDLAYRLDTANFTVQWSDPTVDPARAEALADQLEAAWQALVVEQGWPLPISADHYRLWVILDPGLGGSGFTTEYTSADYPDGYPVMYLNPDYEADRPDYERSVAVHEFGHAIQYAVRPWDPALTESWYWEASAEWMAELGAPELDAYALSTWWYAQAPELAFDSGAASHAYGMVILDAWLAEAVPGDAFQAAWLDQEGEPWEEVLAAVADRDFAEVIGDMAGTYAAEALRESDDYTLPAFSPLEGPGAATALGRLGSFYYTVPDGLPPVVVDGPVVVRFAAGGVSGETPPPTGAYRMVVTPTEADTSFTWRFDTATEGGDEPAACGCAAGGALGGTALWGAVALAFSRRRGPAAPR